MSWYVSLDITLDSGVYQGSGIPCFTSSPISVAMSCSLFGYFPYNQFVCNWSMFYGSLSLWWSLATDQLSQNATSVCWRNNEPILIVWATFFMSWTQKSLFWSNLNGIDFMFHVSKHVYVITSICHQFPDIQCTFLKLSEFTHQRLFLSLLDKKQFFRDQLRRYSSILSTFRRLQTSGCELNFLLGSSMAAFLFTILQHLICLSRLDFQLLYHSKLLDPVWMLLGPDLSLLPQGLDSFTPNLGRINCDFRIRLVLCKLHSCHRQLKWLCFHGDCRPAIYTRVPWANVEGVGCSSGTPPCFLNLFSTSLQ